ncbi:GNAT family N-acetyltransferase [Nitratidesulfovibrio termitidis]|uniref:Sortase-like acyltransferase n=1 Tax=Nitratidesulfovibrio termitidis HI1 TaxID=644897 RepID=W9E4C4_9BACT|nr:GNAT family N-acetyltransferase [Nitratidesulfovibrio termitidis]ETA73123.1 sortase-like acyltransferase [Nitratidesulfovibrio termitidis HI1]
MPRIAIRLATPDDAAAILAVFHAAIHGKAACSYDTAQLSAWCAGRTAEQFRRELELGMNPFLVAEALVDAPLAPPVEDAPGEPPGAATCGPRKPALTAAPSPPPAPPVVGFGALRGDEVAYLYAAPQAPPGTGTALLRELERRAVEQGWPELRLTASLNALDFYKEHGYRELRRDIRVMSVAGGFVRLVAIEARKRLDERNAARPA